jgi:hypothetical protein
MNPAGPQPGMLPNTRQALVPELNTKGSPIQNVARAQASTQAGRSSDQLEPPLSVKGARGVSLAAVQAGTRPKAQEAGQIAPVRNRPSVPAKSPQLAFAASLGTVEPSEDHPQVHLKPRETGAPPSEENTARMQRAALLGFSVPPSLTDARPQPLLSVRVAGREVVRPAEPRVGTLPDAQEARAAPDENPGGVPTRAPQLTAASTPPSPAAHRLVPATSNRVVLLGAAKVRSGDQVHAAPMPATPQAQPADAADLATTAAKQAQLELVPLPPVRLASLGAAEPKGDPEQAFSKVTATKETSSGENTRPQPQSSNTLNERVGAKRAEPQTATRPRAQKAETATPSQQFWAEHEKRIRGITQQFWTEHEKRVQAIRSNWTTSR